MGVILMQEKMRKKYKENRNLVNINNYRNKLTKNKKNPTKKE